MIHTSEKLDRTAPALASNSITSTDLAELATMPATTNGIVATMYASKTMGVNLDLKEMVLQLNRQVKAAKHGDHAQMEAMLLSQTTTLNAIFVEMARRAALNMNTNIPATEAYMRMGLRAQNQARATLETLSTMKHPSVVITKQANITSGPQQVNNMLFDGAGAQTQNLPNQLSGEVHELCPNPRAQGPQG